MTKQLAVCPTCGDPNVKVEPLPPNPADPSDNRHKITCPNGHEWYFADTRTALRPPD